MNMQYLSSESLLQGGRYRIVKMLGSGGFGITYLGTQTVLKRNIVIKEFFMTDYCQRDEYSNLITVPTVSNVEFVKRFKDKFLKEALHIAQLKHPNIVNIIDVFEENGTAYYVMDFIEGGSLAEKVQSEGSLPENVAKRYILQIADALNYIHQQYMNHLDVKPGNIMLSRNDNAILIDFGLSKQYDSQTGHQTSTTPVGISPGYAPMEQYKDGGMSEFSPETDIYSLGATLYYLLTGTRPPFSQEINEDGLPLDQLKAKNISWTTISAIINAMKPRKKERTHDINTFIAELNAGTEGDITGSGNTGQETGQRYQQTPLYGNQQNETVVNVLPPTPDYDVNTSGKRKRKLVLAILCGCGVAVCICGTGILLSMYQGASEPGNDLDDTLVYEDSCEVDSLAIDSALYADSIAAADSLAAIAEEPKPDEQQKISTPTEKKESTPRKKKTRQSNSSTKSSTQANSKKKNIINPIKDKPTNQPSILNKPGKEPGKEPVRNGSNML